MQQAKRLRTHLHMQLTLKISFGFMSRSAGLFADGIDNTVDTISTIFVWLGVRFNRQKTASLFIIIMMFVSVVSVGILGARKIINPEPV